VKLIRYRKLKKPTARLLTMSPLLSFVLVLLVASLAPRTAFYAQGTVGLNSDDNAALEINYDDNADSYDNDANYADDADYDYDASTYDYDDHDTHITYHLPIDITAIGRQGQPDGHVSVRLFDLDLFSPASQIVNQTMSAQHHARRVAMGSDLFESFEGQRQIDINERIAYAADSMNLFTQPMTFRSIGQAQEDSTIPIWVIALVLVACAVLGYVFSKAFAIKRAESEE